MKNKRLDEMTDKQKSKCVQWMIDGALLSKPHPDVDESFLRRATKLNRYEAYTLDKEHPSIKYKMFKNVKLYKNILYNGTVLTPIPANSEKGSNCCSCFFLSTNNPCPRVAYKPLEQKDYENFVSRQPDGLACLQLDREVVFIEDYHVAT